jgi:hypothetical protein
LERAAKVLGRAGEFVWKHARLLDRRLFAFHFEDASGDGVTQALRAYQNPDGGFGNALEADIRCPDSQPVAAEIALEALESVGVDGAMVGQLCDHLLTVTTLEGGVPCVLPSVMHYPRAAWWDTVADPPARINPTAGLAGRLFRLGFAHPWLECATQYCWKLIEEATFTRPHDFLCIVRFLEHVPDRSRAEKAFSAVAEQMLAAQAIAYDPAAVGYVKGPLDFAPTPGSLCRRLFSDALIATHLEALENRQQADGGWPINWPAVSPAGELEWRGRVTVNALRTLAAYDRL